MTHTRHPICFVATTQPEAAEAFYGGVMGLYLIERSAYALVYADGGTMLRVQIVAGLNVATHTVHGWEVGDMNAEIAALTDKGVTFLAFEHLEQDASGVWTTPDGNKIAWFKDPCGNLLSLTEFVQT